MTFARSTVPRRHRSTAFSLHACTRSAGVSSIWRRVCSCHAKEGSAVGRIAYRRSARASSSSRAPVPPNWRTVPASTPKQLSRECRARPRSPVTAPHSLPLSATSTRCTAVSRSSWRCPTRASSTGHRLARGAADGRLGAGPGRLLAARAVGLHPAIQCFSPADRLCASQLDTAARRGPRIPGRRKTPDQALGHEPRTTNGAQIPQASACSPRVVAPPRLALAHVPNPRELGPGSLAGGAHALGSLARDAHAQLVVFAGGRRGLPGGDAQRRGGALGPLVDRQLVEVELRARRRCSARGARRRLPARRRGRSSRASPPARSPGPRAGVGIGRRGLVPSVPVTPTRSPGRAPSRPISFWSRSAQPTIVTLANRPGALTTSPPAIVVPVSSASSSAPSISSSACCSLDMRGNPQRDVGLACLCPHRRDIRQRPRQRLPADVLEARLGVVEAEVRALDDRVDRRHAQLQRFDDRRVVADAAHESPSAHFQRGGDRLDQRELSYALGTESAARFGRTNRIERTAQRCL